MKKIVFIPGIVDKVIGGAEMQMRLISEELRKVDYDIYGILPHTLKNNSRYCNLFLDKRNHFRIPRAKSLFSKRILNYLCKIGPSVIYQRGGLPYLASAVYYCGNHSCSVIWHIASENDVMPLQFGWRQSLLFNWIDKKFLEYGIKNTNYIIGQTKHQNELLKRNYGIECDFIVPNFHPEPTKEIIKEPPVKVLWISNIKSLKKPEVFINLAEHFTGRDSLRFIMIGRPGSRSYQRKLSKRMSKFNNLDYLGEKSLEEVNAVLCRSHILINTSIYEGFPNTFIQAWMRNVPVVSSNVDPDDILKRYKIGFHSVTFDQMVNDVETLVKNRPLREEMGERAQKYAFENHSTENIKKIISLIDKCVT
jgi:glycosyltransferase involved in cell wall biosynthesis